MTVAPTPVRAGARAIAAASVALLISSAGDARASGFATARFGGEHGTVVTTNPMALYYNPAGIAFSDGTHVMVDGQLALRHVSWDHAQAPSDPTDPQQNANNVGKATATNVFGAPALGVTTKLGDLGLGAGLFVPFGGIEHWGKNDAASGLQHDGVQRWHVIDTSITVLYLTGGAAYRLGPVSFGVTGNFVLTAVDYTRAQTAGGNIDSLGEGRAVVEVSRANASVGAGVMVEIMKDKLWAGAAYQAQPGLGPQTLKGTIDVTLPTGGPPRRDVTFTQALPDIVRAGVRFRPQGELSTEGGDYELRLFGDYTRWSVMKSQCLAIAGHPCQVLPDGSDPDPNGVVVANFRRNWKDTVNVRAGGSYWLKPEVELFAGTGIETAATPDETVEPAVFDAMNVQGTFGGRFFIANWLHLATSYTHLQYFGRDTTGKSTLAADKYPTFQRDAGAKLTQWVGILNVNVEKKF